jgi:hypothetical protein
MTWQELVDWMHSAEVQAAVARYAEPEAEAEEPQPQQLEMEGI